MLSDGRRQETILPDRGMRATSRREMASYNATFTSLSLSRVATGSAGLAYSTSSKKRTRRCLERSSALHLGLSQDGNLQQQHYLPRGTLRSPVGRCGVALHETVMSRASWHSLSIIISKL
jgi:hypothetical protein